MGKLRYFVIFLIILLASGIYMTRNFMNMAVVSMVEFDNATTLHSLHSLAYNGWGHSSHCVFDVIYRNESTRVHHVRSSDLKSGSDSVLQSIIAYIQRLSDRRFKWSTDVIARIQGAFFLGYVFLQLQSASLADMHGGSILVVLSVFFSSIVSLVGPFIASNEWIFILSRFICGLAQSCFLPAAFVVLMNWLPKQERTLGLTAISASSSIGTVLIYFSSGFITTGLGWPYLFWIAGAYGLIVSIIAYAFLYSKPQDHPHISRQELIHITSDLSEVERRRLISSSIESILINSDDTDINANDVGVDIKEERQRDQPVPVEVSMQVPWGAILLNKSFIAVLLLKVSRQLLYSYNGSFNAIFNKTVVGLSPEMNGIMSASSSVIHIMVTFPVTIISERIIKNNWMTRTQLRRTACWIDSIGVAGCHMLIPFAVMYTSAPVTLSLIAISSAFGALGVIAEGPIAREMSKNFGHSIFALLNVLAVLFSVVYPSFISLILELNDNSRLGWFIVHWIISGFIIITTIPYGFWASCERQPFDMIKP